MSTEPGVVHGVHSFMASGAPGHGEASPGDHLQTGYRLWLAGHQLGHGEEPWVDPYSFRPEAEQANPAWWPYGLPYWPLVRALGPVLAWNVFTLLCLFAAGLLAYLWLRSLAYFPLAAAAGGLVFEIAPYRIAQSRGHLLGPVSLLLPLALWAFERARRSNDQRWWWASRLAIVSIPLSGQVHLALGAIPFYLAYALCRTRERRAVIEASIGTVAAVLAGLLIKLTVIDGSIDSGGRTLREVNVYSATGLDLVSRHIRGDAEAFVFVGWLTPLVAIAGLVLLVRRRQDALAGILGFGALVPIFLALGTHNPLYAPLWHAFPPLRYPRVPERQMPIACLALAALAAFAVARLRWALLVPVALVALAADLHVRVYDAAAADSGNRAYEALRSQTPGRLLELPVFHPSVQLGSVYPYYDQEAQRERPGGYSTIAPQEAAQLALRLEPLNCGDWRPGTEGLLRRLGVRYVALHAGLYAGTGRAWFAWQALVEHGYGEIARDGAITLFGPGQPRGQPKLPEPQRPLVFCEGWNGSSPTHRHTAFWARGSRLRVALTTREPDRATFSVDGQRATSVRVTAPTVVTVPLGSGGWHLVGVDITRTDRGLRLESVSSVSR